MAVMLTVDAGLPEDGPYDAIHVGAAAPTLPKGLVEQLARPGRMVIPVGTRTQQVLQVRFVLRCQTKLDAERILPDRQRCGRQRHREVAVRRFGAFLFHRMVWGDTKSHLLCCSTFR